MAASGSRLEAVLRAGQSRLQATGGGLPAFKKRQNDELAEREKLAALYLKIFGSDDESDDDENDGSGGNALDGAKSDDDDHDSNATTPYGLQSPSRDEMDVDSDSDGVEPEEDEDWQKGPSAPKVVLKLHGNGEEPGASQQMKDDAAAAMRLHEEMKRATARETRRPARMVSKLKGKSNVRVEEEWW